MRPSGTCQCPQHLGKMALAGSVLSQPEALSPPWVACRKAKKARAPRWPLAPLSAEAPPGNGSAHALKDTLEGRAAWGLPLTPEPRVSKETTRQHENGRWPLSPVNVTDFNQEVLTLDTLPDLTSPESRILACLPFLPPLLCKEAHGGFLPLGPPSPPPQRWH